MKFIHGIAGEVLPGEASDASEYERRTNPLLISFVEGRCWYMAKVLLFELYGADENTYCPDLDGRLCVTEIPSGTRFTYRADPEHYDMILTYDERESWRNAH